ncbi:hypothetical protein TWF106_005110 [Orbilia oligospora]|uniref:Uncharacterized protein n=1 Tax=Orbilia oligospora TaxID=2813651 RepID=A0A6G1MCQ3_ORBOL|nr:hypothetical protein TWF788_007917 [Orbilia oligospora]KAF3217101.1 hypothetical protein TWF191_008780 [Orbilia oligospora]KAF3222445.1 hypothetical protein TWF679_005925 [Orbilia oligospora]KAF3223337.1 hypothetical protein TWF106_005110 [Orbilia oligospora]KAF3253567.1 hypothetical protein TWF192_003820 [Orbilia oligospora]
MDLNVIIALMFLCAGLAILFVTARAYFSHQASKHDVALSTFHSRRRDRNSPESKIVSPRPHAGFGWRWEKKFLKKQDQVKQMLERKLKLLHIMATVKYQDKETNEILDSWKDISTYTADNPICTSKLPSQPPIIQRRLFMFDTIRYLRQAKSRVVGKGMQEWYTEFESVFLLGVLRVDSWKVFLDNCKRLTLATPWFKVWNYRAREHLDFLFMPLITPDKGKLGMMGRFVISFADITLLETPQTPDPSRWAKWWPFSSPWRRSLDWVDLAIDHKKYCESAPPSVPSEELLLENSSIAVTRVLSHKKLIVMDVCKPSDGSDMAFDITSSDLNVHLSLLPLLHAPKNAPIPMELVLILFKKSVQSWSQVRDAFLEHVVSLKSYIYDNRAQKAMINTIMSSLKLTHSLGTVSEHNIIILQKFLSTSTKTIDGNISAFWSWDTHPPTLREAYPDIADDLTKVMEFFETANAEAKDWDKELRDMMQMVFSLVSIDEAYRSREQAQSLKRLSWITFIFLPLLFAASLFGMNVDILENNPSWTWYLVVCVPSLLIVWVVWLAYRFSDRRREISEEIPFKSA